MLKRVFDLYYLLKSNYDSDVVKWATTDSPFDIYFEGEPVKYCGVQTKRKLLVKMEDIKYGAWGAYYHKPLDGYIIFRARPLINVMNDVDHSEVEIDVDEFRHCYGLYLIRREYGKYERDDSERTELVFI